MHLSDTLANGLAHLIVRYSRGLPNFGVQSFHLIHHCLFSDAVSYWETAKHQAFHIALSIAHVKFAMQRNKQSVKVQYLEYANLKAKF